MSTITFLTRERCSLCANARRWVERRTARRGHTLIVIDVDEDPALSDRYGDRVPVVLEGGVEVLSGRFTPGDVRRALR